MRKILVSIVMVMLGPLAAQATTLQPVDAARHVGEQATVCGIVASTHYAGRSRGQPTFLDFGHPYPHQDLAAVVWGDDRDKFGALTELAGQRACVSGTITLYRGAPQIVLHEPAALTQ